MIKLDNVLVHRRDVVAQLLDRDGNICGICKKEFKENELITLDHIHPLSKGGEWTIENLQNSHQQCNSKKSDRIYLENGELEPLPRQEKIARAVRRSQRPTICETCMSGRLLLIGEICPDCNSGPQPAVAPKALQVEPKKCDHDVHHCWLCYLGFVTRTSAIVSVLDGNSINDNLTT